ncbi:XRE family transcriptional regulator [Variovorax sp. GB1P17]|uniref:XRE family transcriptional regulator n=1 Tax=Variovorax sp. GB1P17 TaxID=3443740 RepID=UPI003F44B8C6
MDWQSIIAEIQKRGLSQSQIAAFCRCGQATVSDLANGKTKQPSFVFGQSLLALSKASNRTINRIKAPCADAKAA